MKHGTGITLKEINVATNYYYGGISFTNQISLSKYSTICVEYIGDDITIVTGGEQENIADTGNRPTISNKKTENNLKTICCDISSIKEDNIISFIINPGKTCTIKNIYLVE